MSGRYFKRDGTPVETWAEIGMSDDVKHVGFSSKDNITVSTDFTGVNIGNEDSVLLFETIVKGGLLDGKSFRYHTEKEATEGHQNVCLEAFEKPSNEVKELGDLLAGLNVEEPYRVAQSLVEHGVNLKIRSNNE